MVRILTRESRQKTLGLAPPPTKSYAIFDAPTIEFESHVVAKIAEHINDLRGFFSNVNELLKVGGFFIFEVPDFYKNPGASLNEEHVNHFNLTSISSIAHRFGFELVSDSFGQGSRSFGSVVTLKKSCHYENLSSIGMPQKFDIKKFERVSFDKQQNHTSCILKL